MTTAKKKKTSIAEDYSREIPGNDGNYNWSIKVDVWASGHVGISQSDEYGLKDRVLLSREQ